MQSSQFLLPDYSKIFKLTISLSNFMMIRNKVGSKILFYCHLPIKTFLGIIFFIEMWFDEFNFSIRIIIINITTIVMIIIINSASHTCTVALKTCGHRIILAQGSLLLTLPLLQWLSLYITSHTCTPRLCWRRWRRVRSHVALSSISSSSLYTHNMWSLGTTKEKKLYIWHTSQ